MLAGDRQTQAASPEVARRVGLVETLEDQRQLIWRDARPTIEDSHQELTLTPYVARQVDRDLDRRAFPVHPGVVEQVADHALQPAAIRDHLPRAGSDYDTRTRSVGADHGAHERLQIELGRLELLGGSVEARDLHQVIHERPQARDVGHEELAHAPPARRHVVEVLPQHRGLVDQRRQRRSQLVRDVGHEAPLASLGCPQLGDGRLQRGGHAIERGRPATELVARLDIESRRQVAGRHPLRGVSRAPDGIEQPSRQGPGDDRRDQDQDQAAHDKGLTEALDRALHLGRVEEEVEGRSVRRALGGRHEQRPAVNGQPLVADVAALRDRPQRRGELAEVRGRVEAGCEGITVAEVDDRPGNAAEREGVHQRFPAPVVSSRPRRDSFRGEHGDVEVREVTGGLDLLVAQRCRNVRVRGDAEDQGRERDEADDREGQSAADSPKHQLPGSGRDAL